MNDAKLLLSTRQVCTSFPLGEAYGLKGSPESLRIGAAQSSSLAEHHSKTLQWCNGAHTTRTQHGRDEDRDEGQTHKTKGFLEVNFDKKVLRNFRNKGRSLGPFTKEMLH